MMDEPIAACPDCGAPVQRIIGAAGIVTRSEKSKLSDKSLKKAGFKKFVKEGDGKYRNVLA
jgi:predicted nucleic acid-binding Zn ribbon protein